MSASDRPVIDVRVILGRSYKTSSVCIQNEQIKGMVLTRVVHVRAVRDGSGDLLACIADAGSLDGKRRERKDERVREDHVENRARVEDQELDDETFTAPSPP